MPPDGSPHPGPDPIAGITDPWRYLAAVKETIPKRDRAPYIQPLMDLVEKEHPLHQAAILKEAAEIFGVPVGLLRDEMAARAKKARSSHEPRFLASIAEQGILAEMVYRPGDLDHQTGYLVVYMDKPGEPPVFLPEVTLGKQQCYPFAPWIARDKVAYFPDSYEEYGSDDELFRDILVFLGTYIQVDKPIILTVAAAYILMSWVYDQFLEIPYLRAIGDYGVGKSRFITTVGLACYRPTLASGALTGPAIFRLIEQIRGALVIDEADFEQGTEIHQDLTKILNVGFQQRYPIFRNEKGEDGVFQTKPYQVFGPKILATRRGFKDTALESRCFSQPLPLMDVDPKIPIYLDWDFDQHVQKLRNKLLLWRFRHWGHIDINPYMRFAGMEPRLNQILLPLLSVTSSATIREAILTAARETTDAVINARLQTLEGKIVETVLWLWWNRPKKVDRILLKSITERLQNVGELKDITSQRVSNVLTKVLDIKTDYKGGQAWVSLVPRQVISLAKQYHLEIPDDYLGEIPNDLLVVSGLMRRYEEILIARGVKKDGQAEGKPDGPTPVKRRAL